MRTIIIKIGSSSIIMRDGRFNHRRFAYVIQHIKMLKDSGYSVVIVVSGAVASGARHVNGFTITRRVAAGIGQVRLITQLQKVFRKNNITVAQILISKHDFNTMDQQKNLKILLEKYLENHVIPVFNENDVLNLNSFGGNDYLAKDLAFLLNGEEVIIISSMRESHYGVGGKTSKIEVQKQLAQRNIKTQIVNSDKKYTLLI